MGPTVSTVCVGVGAYLGFTEGYGELLKVVWGKNGRVNTGGCVCVGVCGKGRESRRLLKF